METLYCGNKYMHDNEIICLFSFKEILRQSPDHDVGPAIAHFLNCFLGKMLSASTKGSVGSTQSETQKVCYPVYSCLAIVELSLQSVISVC